MGRPSVNARVARSITLLRAFVIASGITLAAAAIVLGGILTTALRGQAVADAKLSLTQYSNGVLTSRLVRDGDLVVDPAVRAHLERDVHARPDVLSVKVWRPDGVLLWTNVAPERIGRRFEPGHHLAETLASGQAEAELESLHDAEDAAESKLGVEHVLEVYAPIFADGKVVGAYEIYADSSAVEAAVARSKRTVWAATGVVFAVLLALLLLLVRGASRTLRRQTDELRKRSRALMESYRRLEESALEAIESLNAAVEAKDAYTAGHSLRVQRIALAVGEEVGLAHSNLDALRFSALFHDIGKLAVPDAVLTKPDRLTPEEFELIKQHSEEGARIVGKLGRLRPTIVIIRHHHERWDGTGYPDGLAGDAIPVEASVVALADAWDAMTTDRPYHRALTFEEALAEVRDGRGTQFAPAVVDAFFAVLRRGGLPANAAGEPVDVAEAG